MFGGVLFFIMIKVEACVVTLYFPSMINNSVVALLWNQNNVTVIVWYGLVRGSHVLYIYL